MFAVVSHKGNQYQVEAGKEYNFDLFDTDEKEVTFSEVLLVSDDKEVKVGTPKVDGASVVAQVLGVARGEKQTAMKFRPKKRYQRHLGHKQDFTRIKILSINC